ncbi:MAG: CotH kinase family protein [Bacteroidota bacterium]
MIPFRLWRLWTLILLFPIFSLEGQVNFSNSNLPIVIIDTQGATIVDEPKITAQMGIIDNGPDQRNALDDPFNGYEGLIGIEIRGASSQSYDKKSFALETRKEDGSNRNVALLGMPKENDWILHGPYGDKSLIRNALAYHLAGKIMDYAPRGRFCELIVNGDYRGVYLLLEKIKRDKNRVNIDKIGEADQTGDELTGGYMLKMDKFEGINSVGWTSEYPPQDGAWQSTVFQYHYPKSEDLNDAQKNYIQGLMQDFEDLMRQPFPEFNDSLDGYHKYIDPSSFVDFILINEMCKNVDAYRLSTYLYKNKNSIDPLIKAGPVWDFNLGFGNVNFCMGPSTEDWVLDYNNFCPEDNWLVHFWWRKLMTDPDFVVLLKDRWARFRQGCFKTEQIMQDIDSLANLLGEAQVRNFQRWPILGVAIWPNAIVGDSYNEEVVQLKSWLKDRLLWLDEAIAKKNAAFVPTQGEGEEYLAYPNPFTEEITIEFPLPSENPLAVDIYVYNSIGQKVDEISIFIPFGPRTRSAITWSPDIAIGTYHYTIVHSNEVQYHDVLIKW